MIDYFRVRQSVPFIRFAQKIGMPMSHLNGTYLNPDLIIERVSDIVPSNLLWDFLNKAVKSEGLPQFGILAVSSVSILDIMGVSNSSLMGKSLYDLMKVVSTAARKQGSNADYRFDFVPGGIFLSRKSNSNWLNQYCVTADTALVQGMINFVRSCSGKEWFPRFIHLTGTAPLGIEFNGFFGGAIVKYNCVRLGIYIPERELRNTYIPDSNVMILNDDDHELLGESKLVEGTKSLIRHGLEFDTFGIDNIAHQFGINRRKFQRLLAKEGMVYSDMIAAERNSLAKQLLDDEDYSIKQISKLLRYKNLSSFSRAFRNENGFSPLMYRKIAQ